MDNQEQNLLSVLSAIQGQLIGLQSNLNFVQQSIVDLKKDESETRSDLNKFANVTRDRLKTVETQFNLIKWGLLAITATILTIGTTRLLSVMGQESRGKSPEKRVIQQEMKKPLDMS